MRMLEDGTVVCPKTGLKALVEKDCLKCKSFRRKFYAGQCCGDMEYDQISCDFKGGE